MGFDQTNRDLNQKASELVSTLANALDSPYHGSSFMTPCIYDTAWVAMVPVQTTKDASSSCCQWLFPECFEHLMGSQRDDGGFGEGSSEVDGILNTMAAVLALCKYRNSLDESQDSSTSEELRAHITRGETYLRHALGAWDVNSTVHVGFEILVPKLLDLLGKEDIHFEFPGSKLLATLRERKMCKTPLAALYLPAPTTLLHSLEAFVGDIDMNRMQHHIVNGSMMASPASTAAYLMNLSGWDSNAEAYLRFVVKAGNGAIPSAFPASVFETSWALTTLLDAGFTQEDLGRSAISTLKSFLSEQLRLSGGTIGFASGVLADADDTAKATFCLRLLGCDVPCENMISMFDAENHFKTFKVESSESFSANCNILIALTASGDALQYLPQIAKALSFLCQKWWEGAWGDKWNLEPQYCMMLFSQGLVRVLEAWDSQEGFSDATLDATIREHMPLATLQILARTLSTQAENGSWGDTPEVTAYAILTLAGLVDLPWVIAIGLEQQVSESMLRGTEYLNKSTPSAALIWVEKVTYGSPVLSQAYCLAAQRKGPRKERKQPWQKKAHEITRVMPSSDQLNKFAKFFGRLPLFAEEPAWRLHISIAEGFTLLPKLRQALHEISLLPDVHIGESHQQAKGVTYLDYIPLTWTTCNNAGTFGISPESLFDMLIISAVNFQMDKYLEEVTEDQTIVSAGKHGFEVLRCVVRSGLDATCEDGSEARTDHVSSGLLKDVEQRVARFKKFILDHPAVVNSTPAIRCRVRKQLDVFLVAHIAHGEHNATLRQARPIFLGAGSTTTEPGFELEYYDWVHGISADHTSCPYSFDFFTSLISRKEAASQRYAVDCFSSTAEARYLASDICRHLATMCRQYNDYGSTERDHAEGNLNSVNFPEFGFRYAQMCEPGKVAQSNGGCQGRSVETNLSRRASGIDQTRGSREELMRIAEYERECLMHAVNRLRTLVGVKTAAALDVFITVTDLYGQIYVVRDINPSR